MKALAKLVADFVAWRWAPTVAILTASLFYVLVVVGLVPTEIDVPITNARFHPKPVPTAASEASLVPVMETTPAAAPMPVARTQPLDFGRRGFSPPLARPDPPPSPSPPPPPPPPMVVPPAPPVAPPPPEPAPEPPVATAPTPIPPGLRGFRGGLPRNVTGLLQNVSNAIQPITGVEPAAPPGAPPGSAAPEAPPPPQ